MNWLNDPQLIKPKCADCGHILQYDYYRDKHHCPECNWFFNCVHADYHVLDAQLAKPEIYNKGTHD